MKHSLRTFTTHAAVLVLGIALGYPAGRLLTEGGRYAAQSERETTEVRPFLQAHRPAYDRVSIEWSSNGPIYFQGSVPTEEDRRRLIAEVQRLFGEKRAQTSVQVDVAAASSTPPAGAGR